MESLAEIAAPAQQSLATQLMLALNEQIDTMLGMSQPSSRVPSHVTSKPGTPARTRSNSGRLQLKKLTSKEERSPNLISEPASRMQTEIESWKLRFADI